MASTKNKEGINTEGILNEYTIMPRNLTQYTAFRGVTDFTNIGQFKQYKTGYSFLSVLQTPTFINKIASSGSKVAENVKKMQNSFVHMLEYEFRGLDGLPDMTADTMEITDGNNAVRLINNVTWDTAATISMNYFEKSGGLITKYSEYYLTGLVDRMTKAKTYHGAIRAGYVEPGPENEIFTLLYYVTDETMLRLERAVLLCNCQLTKAELSAYNGQRGEYGNKEMSIEFNCFPVIGQQVDKAASKLLQDITAVEVKNKIGSSDFTWKKSQASKAAQLDSYGYKFGIMNSNSKDYLKSLTNAIG